MHPTPPLRTDHPARSLRAGRRPGRRPALGSALGSAPGWQLLQRQLTATRGPLLRLLAWSGVEALPPLVSGLFVSAAVDQGFLLGRPGVGVAWLGGFGAAMTVRAYATRAGFPHLAGVVEPLRDALVERVVRSALHRPSADPAELARLTEQVEAVRQLTATLLRTLRGVGVTLVAALIGLTLLAPAVLPLVLLPLSAAGLLFARLLRPLVARRRAVVLAEERLAAEAGRALHGLRDVQATGTGDEVARALTAAARESAAASRALGRASALRALVVAVGGRLPVLAVLAAAPWLLARHALTPGELLGVATYLVQQLDPAVRTLAGTVGGWLLDLAVVLDRLATTTAAPAVLVPARAGSSAPPGDTAAEVRLTGVRFGHGGGAVPVLAGLDASLRPGEHVAVVGPSGAGKSTLAALLAGVLEPTAGRVTVGGVRPEPARLVALVPQEAYVFPGSVRDNLLWLAPDTDDARLAAAVALLGAEELVARLGGPTAVLAAALGDSGELSAGERQLLALVRTYLSPAPVVVLDEATCHLDPAAEERVERAFAARPGTLVVVAHRISSALRADRVLLLDGGHGLLARHGDLQVLSPLYRELVGHWLGSAPRTGAGLAS
ncbi:ATP-binding cassette subfamily C protein [Streptomyces sp. 1114.5]|uniref:ATP-binding cassette domain-containing protein n=1 Tax=Streptomyces sp. 1114.5 TaxID=1938830 RepID=UPI000EB58AF6|nr:ABC transporter ATP-binding protein [Streptomyces sp. 1114.5]RKT18223.1 ATP-binding cassette subfamily C protein [Streptomyces sp. 1114.5]